MKENYQIDEVENTSKLASARADERNHYLSFYEKYFKGEKVSENDVLYDEALKMDEKLENLVNEGKAKNYEEAIAEMANDINFQNKSEYEVFIEEFARAAALKFARDISANRFDENNYYSSYNKILDQSESSPFKKQFNKDFSPDGGLAMTGLEIMNDVMPLLKNYQREILQEKIAELNNSNDQQKINLIRSNHYFNRLLENK